MKRLLLMGAVAMVIASLVSDEASAQRVRAGGGGIGIGGGGRIAAMPGGYAGRIGIAPGGYAIRGGGWRRGFGGWGFPVAAGLAAAGALAYYGYPAYGYSSYGYSDPCVAWNGYQWVGICRPYDYNYGNNSMW